MMICLLLGVMQIAEVPDRCWEGWWPATQWSRDATPPTDAAVRRLGRAWEWIDYPSLETCWGTARATVNLERRKEDGPPTGFLFYLNILPRADVTEKEPQNEDFEAEIVTTNGQVLSRPVAAPWWAGWDVNQGSTSGKLIVGFGWLPQSLDDRWIRLKTKGRTAWILLPYGLGDDPNVPLKETAGAGDAPKRPIDKTPNSVQLTWERVHYDLGWMDGKGTVDAAPPADLDRERRDAWIRERVNVMASLANPLDGATVELELYRERGVGEPPWCLTRPRTTAAIGVPGSRILFSSITQLRRDEMHRRYDGFKLWRPMPHDRRWGCLRVTLEETVFEVAVPGSLFQWTQGHIDGLR